MGLSRIKLGLKEKNTIWLILVVLLGVVIRCFDPAFRSFWGDEMHSFYVARSIVESGQWPAILSPLWDGHQPLYFILLAGWIKLFGQGELALRSLSVLIGSLALLAIYPLGKRLFDQRIALIATFFLAISPLAIMHSQELRMYGLALLLSVLTADYFYRLLQGGKNRGNCLLFFGLNLLLLLTHAYAVLLVAAELAVVLFRWRRQPEPLLLGLLVADGAIAFPFFLPLLIGGLGTALSSSGEMAFAVFPWYLKGVLITFVLTLGETVAPWNVPVVVPAGLICCYLLFRAARSWREWPVAFALALTVIPVAIAVILLRPTMPKYLIIVLPFYLLLLARGLVMVRSTWLRWSLIIILIGTQLVAIGNYYTGREYHNSNQIEPWRTVAGELRAGYCPDDLIVTTNNYIVYRLTDYYLNITSPGDYPVFCLQRSIADWGLATDGRYPVYGADRVYTDILQAQVRRIWLVEQIADDRYFPAGYLAGLKSKLSRQYQPLKVFHYVPYEQTLVARLPIKRHPVGTDRITLTLYKIK